MSERITPRNEEQLKPGSGAGGAGTGRTQDEEILNAYHEAAHAVANHRLCFLFDEVTVERDGDSEGHVLDVDDPEEWAAFFDRSIEEYRASRTIQMLAGYAVEIEFGIRADLARDHARCDFEDAREVGALNEANEAEWIAKAAGFVRENMRAIGIVADALIKHRTLRADDVSELVRMADEIEAWRPGGNNG